MQRVADREVPGLDLEQTLLEEGHQSVAGLDEVGRGSWAGPVVAAAVMLPLDDTRLADLLVGVRDSKMLSRDEREQLVPVILEVCRAASVGWATRETIDRIGIAAANRRAMLRAVARLTVAPDALVVDHVRLPSCPLPQLSVPRGDSRSLSIAAASILAKVVRDRWMCHCDRRYPGYGFANHKGYGTPTHRAAVASLGPCAMHRLSFRPFAATLL